MAYRRKQRPLLPIQLAETFKPLCPPDNWDDFRKVLRTVSCYEGVDFQRILHLLHNAFMVQTLHDEPRKARREGRGNLINPVIWLEEIASRSEKLRASLLRPMNPDGKPWLRGISANLSAVLFDSGWDGKDFGRLCDCAVLLEHIAALANKTIQELKRKPGGQEKPWRKDLERKLMAAGVTRNLVPKLLRPLGIKGQYQ